METTHMESAQESKENGFMSVNCSNDTAKEMEKKLDVRETASSITKMSPFCETLEENDVDAAGSSEKFHNSATFKKPTVLVGTKRSRPLGKMTKTSLMETREPDSVDRLSDRSASNSQEHSKDPPFPYAEPPWGGKPKDSYKMEVLKSGVIVETISLSERSFYVIGRLPSCHVPLAHPTVSRCHAILQYRSIEDKENSKGFYVYDLGSTHGTFWNGNHIKPNVYVRVQGGHMLRFGCSQRKYILQAPQDDQEEESRYTLTELKEIRASELEERLTKNEIGPSTERKESEGIDWGMGEDADEETDLQENPYACIADDDLVLEDPKKTLRGWFEREGYDLQYQTEEKGLGQFLCWVDLPTEDVVGRSIRAEALVKGKKKEAVVQCALEACKILDKYGLLRQANHEARKRKTRNWEAEDYYDSDEDNFLDRTGSVERKREQRMRLAGKLEEKVETYDSLLRKHKEVTERVSHLSTSIKNWQNVIDAKKETTEEDALDAFMSTLSSSALTKSDIAKMKLELQNLQKEKAGLVKLLNLTRPANLPPLTCQDVIMDQTVQSVQTKTGTTARGTSSEANRLQDTVLRRARKKQASHRMDAKSSTSAKTVTTGQMEAESEEESDSDHDDNKVVGEDKQVEAYLNSPARHFPQFKHSTSTANEFLPESGKKKEGKCEVKATRKSRQERQRIPCDQDVYTDNYSTWVPPQDQAGDGKTILNEKYGY